MMVMLMVSTTTLLRVVLMVLDDDDVAVAVVVVVVLIVVILVVLVVAVVVAVAVAVATSSSPSPSRPRNPKVFFRWQNGSTTESSHQALSHATARRAQTFRKLPGSSRRARGSDVSQTACSESTRLTARQRQRQRQRRRHSHEQDTLHVLHVRKVETPSSSQMHAQGVQLTPITECELQAVSSHRQSQQGPLCREGLCAGLGPIYNIR